MKLAVEVRWVGDGAVVAGVAFDEWGASEPDRVHVTRVDSCPRPPRGEPDRRQAQCIVALLREHALSPEALLVDGLVFLDPQDTPGPGAYVHQALEGRVPVIGLGRSGMKAGTPEQFEVHREDETPPLVVTCAGIDLGAAKARVRAMHGRKRVPTLMKRVARLAREAAGEAAGRGDDA